MRIFVRRVVVNAKAMEPEANLVEKYFGVKYGYEKMSNEQLNVCRTFAFRHFLNQILISNDKTEVA
jgi:hypothetical protein